MLPYVDSTEVKNHRKSLVTSRENVFLGLNHRAVVGANEFSDVLNLTNDEYPALQTREPRWSYTGLANRIPKNTVLYWKNGMLQLMPGLYNDLTHVYDDDSLMYDDVLIENWYEKQLSNFGEVAEIGGTRKISVAAIGSTVLFMPYGAWFDTRTRECGKLIKDCAISGDYNYPASITVCWENGNALFSITSGASLPAAGTLNAAFILESDTSKLYKCTTASSEGVVAAWTEVTSVKYVFTFKDKGYSFAERPSYGTLKYYYIAPHSGFIKKSSDIFAATETKYVPTYSSLTENWTLTFPSAAIDFDILRTEMRGDVTIARFEVYNDIPDIDYVCAAYNRVWGCGRNGTEIYASALGDATKWHSYEGRVSDSWAATVAEGGEWTGAVTYDGYPLFFKKDRVFRVSGSKPSSFGYRAYSMMGCYDNASFAVVNDRLYYMGKDGIYVYTGAAPRRISDKIGGAWTSAVGAEHNNKYYCWRNDEEVLVYDPAYDTWQRESDRAWYSVTKKDGETIILRAITSGAVLGGAYITTFSEEDDTQTQDDALDWYFETGDIMDSDAAYNYIYAVEVMMKLGAGADCRVYVEYDLDGNRHKIEELTAANKDTDPLVLYPRRCRHFRLRFEGKGDMTLYQITKFCEEAFENG